MDWVGIITAIIAAIQNCQNAQGTLDNEAVRRPNKLQVRRLGFEVARARNLTLGEFIRERRRIHASIEDQADALTDQHIVKLLNLQNHEIGDLEQVCYGRAGSTSTLVDFLDAIEV